MANILIVGATSAIAQETGKIYAERGDALYLLARDQERLQMIAEDCKVRGARWVETAPLDITDFEATFEAAFAAFDAVDVVLLAHGVLPDQDRCEHDFDYAREVFDINATHTLLMLLWLAQKLERQKKGTMVAISSVAGDRGRRPNYLYGAAKGAVAIALQGLRSRLERAGVSVLTVKPGFVDTPMTAAFKKGALWASPESVAQGIVKGVDGGKDVVYLPFFWRFIMLAITSVPEILFKKFKF